MKYLFIIIVLLSCKNVPEKVMLPLAEKDTVSAVTIKRDTSAIDTHDPYQTGKDTIRLNIAMDKIFKFPEVQAISKQIGKTTNGKHSASIMVSDEFNEDPAYYSFMVGDNSHDDRYVNILFFSLKSKPENLKHTTLPRIQ